MPVAATTGHDARVDAYIAKAQPFARPILEHLRDQVHRACPKAEETIKWQHPFFLVEGTILCSLMAFKQHCAFGIWNREVGAALKATGAKTRGSMGFLGHITSVKEIPSNATLKKFLQQAEKAIHAGYKPMSKPGKRTPKPEAKVPPVLAAALKKNKTAAENFSSMSASHRREYVEWINEAKRDETRDARVAKTIAALTEGKSRYWQYGR